MATRAGVLGEVLGGDGVVGILDVLDGVNAMAIGTDGSQAVAAGNSLPVDAGHERLRDLGVTLAAGGRHVEFIDGRMVFVGGQNLMRAVAIGTYRGLLRTVFDGPSVHTLLIGNKRLRTDAVGGVDELLP